MAKQPTGIFVGIITRLQPQTSPTPHMLLAVRMAGHDGLWRVRADQRVLSQSGHLPPGSRVEVEGYWTGDAVHAQRIEHLPLDSDPLAEPEDRRRFLSREWRTNREVPDTGAFLHRRRH
jgi:hypothetical protein